MSFRLACTLCLWFAEPSADIPSTPVGMAGRLDQVVLPGSELEAAPITDPKTPIVVRVLATFPHGAHFRYDLEYVGLAAGEYNLCSYLRRKDGSNTGDLPPLKARIEPSLPAGALLPHAPEPAPVPWLGGYRAMSIALAAAWALGLAAILLWGRKRRREALAAARPLTFADQLRPLVESALSGRGRTEDLASLERVLLGYWRRRLQVEQLHPRAAIGALRDHPEAGQLLRSLENWLHRPGGDKGADVEKWLRPYQHLPPEPWADGEGRS